jgi:hypothetical protein
MSDIYFRPKLASDMAKQLLHPSTLDIGLRSGLFLSGLRRTGKTTFLLNDFIPELEAQGALVIYIDLWSDIKQSPTKLVLSALKKILKELATPSSAVLTRLKKIKGMDLGVFGFKFGFKIDAVDGNSDITISRILTEIIDIAKTDVVLILDEVQQALTTDDGEQLMLALKAARDAVNPRPNTPGHFLLVGTGSHRAMVHEMTARKTQAFKGAISTQFPLLDETYVDFLRNKLASDHVPRIPSRSASIEAFKTLGSRPEEMLKALRTLATLPKVQNVDTVFGVIAQTLRTAAADLEIEKVAEMGGLATAIFDKVAAANGSASGLFTKEAAADYSAALGREVKVEDIQPTALDLVAKNLIMRLGHGQYAITDPFVQEVWSERKAILGK